MTIHDHVKEDLKLVFLFGDPALYIKPNEENLDALMAVYVDGEAMKRKLRDAEVNWEDSQAFWIQTSGVGRV